MRLDLVVDALPAPTSSKTGACNGPRWQRWALVALAAVVLAACGDKTATTPAAGPAAPAPALPVAAPPEDARTLLTKANAAFRANRMVAPAGDNALEHALHALQQDPSNAGATELLVDITPIAASAIEGAISAGNFAEAERVMSLLSSGNPTSLTVQSLQRRLATATRPAPVVAPPPAATATVTSPPPAVPAPVAAAAPPSRASSEPVAVARAGPGNVPALASSAPATRAPATSTAEDVAARSPAAEAAPADAEEAPPAAPPPRAAPASGRSTDPVATAKVSPDYPPAAKKRRTEGWVELQFMVGVDGVPRQIQVLRAQPAGLFDRSAVRALGRWKFRPAQRDGQPVEALARTTINFKLG